MTFLDTFNYILCAVTFIYLYHALFSLSLPFRTVKFYFAMCLSASLLTATSFFNYTFDLPNIFQLNAFNMIYLAGFGSYYFYLKILQQEFKIQTKTLRVFEKILGFICTFYFGTLLIGFLTGSNPLTLIQPFNHANIFLAKASPFIDQSNLSKGVIALSSFTIIFLTIYLLKISRRYFPKEYLLISGLVVTLFVVINDIMIGLQVDPRLVPISFMGFGLEIVRFHYSFQRRHFKKVEELKQHYERLTDRARTSFVVQSLFHDLGHLKSKLTTNKDSEESSSLSQAFDLVLGPYKSYSHTTDTFQAFHLSGCLSKAANFKENELFESQINLIQNIPHQITVSGNSEDFIVAMGQLFSNAIQELNHASIDRTSKKIITLEIRPQNEDHKIVLAFRDNGTKIIPDIAKKIFEPGFSTKSQSGLGMSICRDLLREMGATIRLDSEAESPCFLITLQKA